MEGIGLGVYGGVREGLGLRVYGFRGLEGFRV